MKKDYLSLLALATMAAVPGQAAAKAGDVQFKIFATYVAPDGKITDYNRAAHRLAGETVVFSWVEWPSKEARTTGWERIMADERMKHDPADQTFDGKRMIYGGFQMVAQV